MIFRKSINFANGRNANLACCAVVLALNVPSGVVAQNANPWNPNAGQNTQSDPAYGQQAPVPNQTWSADRPPSDLYAPADLAQQLATGRTRGPVVAPNAVVAQPSEPARYASDDLTITNPQYGYRAPIQPGSGYSPVQPTYNVAPQTFGYAPAQQGFAYGAAPQNYGFGGVPQQGFGYGSPVQGNGFYPGYNPGQSFNPGGYPNNSGGYFPSGGSYPGGTNSNFFGFTPFGFF